VLIVLDTAGTEFRHLPRGGWQTAARRPQLVLGNRASAPQLVNTEVFHTIEAAKLFEAIV
jgi:hypothetical protein